MVHDIMSQFYSCLTLPLQEKLSELTKIIDQPGPNKDMQVLFPQLINNILESYNCGWGLKTITNSNRYEFDCLINFLEPLGPMFRLIYKLLSDPQLKYNLPLSSLPMELQLNLQKGRCPQFYSDMLTMDSQSMNVVALALNPFDFYIMNFALHLVNNNQHNSSWDNWDNVYFVLSCEYLMHFLPSDPNIPVLPPISNYTGKVPMSAPLQTANRPLVAPSLLLSPDLTGMSNQHTPTPTQSRNEIWRSETILQVFIDVWMSVEHFGSINMDMYERYYPVISSSPERVRLVRVLVKHLHAFSARHLSDSAIRSSALRKYARQIMSTRAYSYIKHLVTTWPLDGSFRLVMELWLSFIQPWRYVNNDINQDRFSGNNNQEEGSNTLDSDFLQLIAENFPTYTCIFQLVMPRFMRLDLTAYKNAVMLFRLGKVFSQDHLVPILKELEQKIVENNNTSGLYHSMEISQNTSYDHSSSYNGAPLHKWVPVAKQALSELNMSQNYEYQPIWSDCRKKYALEFVSKILAAKQASEKVLDEYSRKLSNQNKGLWASVKLWLMINDNAEEELSLEECRKVPICLNNAIHYFINIFSLNENSLIPAEPITEDCPLEHSSFTNSSNFPMFITNKLRSKPSKVQYMGDPDLSPITSYESTILVRILYQLSSRLNEMYGEQFTRLWQMNNLRGYITREILQRPCTIHNYMKSSGTYPNIVSQELPARLSLRRLGSYAFVVWTTIGYLVFRLFSYSGFFYVFILIFMWMLWIFTKATLKMVNIMKS